MGAGYAAIAEPFPFFFKKKKRGNVLVIFIE